MGVSIEAWRAKIGGFAPSIRSSNPGHLNPTTISFVKGLVAAHLLSIATLFYALLLLSGNVESNPGPGPSQFMCKHEGCDATFAQATNRNRHQRTAHNLTGNQQLRCDFCTATFSRAYNRLRHQRENHGNHSFVCGVCRQEFRSQRGLSEHCKYEHGPESENVVCHECGCRCVNKTSLQAHARQCHSDGQVGLGESNLRTSAFDGYLKNYSYYPSNDEQVEPKEKRVRVDELLSDDTTPDHPIVFLSENKDILTEDLNTNIELGAIKFLLTFQCTLQKSTADNTVVYSSPVFQSSPYRILNSSEISNCIDMAFDELMKKLDTYQRDGSGWRLESVDQLDLHVGKYVPLAGSTYMKLPDAIRNKRAIINIKNDDEYCFLYCILASLFPVSQHPERVSNYNHHISFTDSGPTVNGLNLDGITFPVKLSQIDKFEKQNDRISVNVYSTASEKDETIIYPIRISADQAKTVINLMYVSNDDPNSHYTLIRSISRLLNSQNSHQLHHCPYCLHGFRRHDLLKEHTPYCAVHSSQRIVMPTDESNRLYFKDGHKQLPIPYILVADFECSIKTHDKTTDKHVPNSFCLQKVAYDGNETFDPIVYVGVDAPAVFAKVVDDESRWILNRQQINRGFDKRTMTQTQMDEHNSADTCHICTKPLNNEDKVIDHDHVTGVYRGPAHSKCNLRYRLPPKIPLFFHNFSKYDLKIVVDGIRHNAKKINVIPENMENYISMDIDKVRYLDSYRFLDASLESLVEKLKDTGEFKHTKTWLGKQGYLDHVDLLLKKNAYPYEWVDSLDKLTYPGLPPRSSFHSRLTDSDITEEQYGHALKVYNTLNMTNFEQYHRLYLTLDVLLLSDVLTNFRKTCIDDDGLDPCHYYTMPNYSFDAMLKSTDVNFELLTDPTMYLAFENNIRGGISVISHRQAEANNPYLSDYDSTKPTSYLMYVDAVNLYGWAMQQPLPISNFRWLTKEEVAVFDITSVQENGPDCLFLEVDLDYPPHLHKCHSDYPLAPEPLTVTDCMLSTYCSKLKEKLGLGRPNQKLTPNLLPKRKYLCHYRNLQFYIKHGLTITKIHRIISCKQTDWLKPFIDANTEKRINATSTLDKDFYKKKNNSTYGKLEQNTRKYQRVELTNNKKRVKKLIADPSYLSHKIFFGDKDDVSLAAIHRQQTTLKLNKPIYAGFAILELSKLLMFSYYYDHLKPKYGDNITLCFTDTDSLLIHVTTPDIYKDMLDDKHLYDTTDYPHDHFLHSTDNKKIPGKFSDETNGIPIKGFVGLRSKMYAIKLDGGDEKRRVKGIPRRLIKKNMTYDHFTKCLHTQTPTTAQYSSIQSTNMQLYTKTTNKIALSCYDDKRYVMECGVKTLAYGHCEISQ